MLSTPAQEEGGFVVLPRRDTLPGQVVHTMPATDIERCKHVCRELGPPQCGAFVVRAGIAHFKRQSVGECRAGLVEDPTSTTYLNSSPQASLLCKDIRAAVVKGLALKANLQELLPEKTDALGSLLPSQDQASAKDAEASPPESESIWRECVAALEGEIRRKTAAGHNLQRRIHVLEAELQEQLEVADGALDSVQSLLESSLKVLEVFPTSRAEGQGNEGKAPFRGLVV